MQTATPLSGTNPAQGSGVTDIDAAVSLVKSKGALPATAQDRSWSSGLGSLEASRGGEHVVDPETGDALTGKVDALGSPWRPQAWVAQRQGQLLGQGRLERHQVDRNQVGRQAAQVGHLGGQLVERRRVGRSHVVLGPVPGTQLAREQLEGTQLAW